MKTFYVKTRILTGSGSMEYLHELSNRTIWIICDGFLESSGGIDASNRVEVYTDVVPDPPTESIIDGVCRMAQLEPHIVIALGGGSAIDTAKGGYRFRGKQRYGYNRFGN